MLIRQFQLLLLVFAAASNKEKESITANCKQVRSHPQKQMGGNVTVNMQKVQYDSLKSINTYLKDFPQKKLSPKHFVCLLRTNSQNG